MTLHERWFSVPDFESKLNLLQQRSARLYGIGEPRLLHLRKDIAAALGINHTLLSRWSKQNRIPKMDVVVKLARLFAIDHAWLALPYDEFKDLCEGRPAAHTWQELMQLAREDGVGKIEELDDEAPEIARLLHARPSFIFSMPGVERVHVGSSIRVSFDLPLSRTSAPLWSGWNVVLFSQDPSGYSCLLPRFAEHHGFPSGRLRSDTRFALPPLTVDTPGLCSVILIASRESVPLDLHTLLVADEEGEAFSSAIARTAAHMTPLVLAENAGVMRLRYLAL